MSIMLLAAIATARHRGLQRDFLAKTFWPDREALRARSCLRQVLTELRKVFAQGHGVTLIADTDLIRIDAAPGHIDLRDFEDLIDTLRADEVTDDALVHAAELYRGTFMEGVDFDPLEHQSFIGYRETLQAKALRLVEAMSLRGTLVPETTRLATRLLTIDASAEEAHRALIRAAIHEGHTNRARKQLEQCRKILGDELGAEPEPQTIALLDTYLTQAATAKTSAAKHPTQSHPPSIAPPRALGLPAIAVLPFRSIAVLHDVTWLDRISHDVTTALSRNRLFSTLSWQSSYAYKGQFDDARAIGNALDVSYFIDGSVQTIAAEMVLTLQLVSTRSGGVVWCNRMRESIPDTFDQQDDLVHRIHSAVYNAVRTTECATVRPTDVDALTAYDMLFTGYPLMLRQTAESNAQALTWFKRAVARDRAASHALSLQAWTYAQRRFNMWTDDPKEACRLALEYAGYAEASVADDASELAALGATYTLASDDAARARRLLDRCLRSDPYHVWGWTYLGWLHAFCDEPAAALTAFEEAERLTETDPLRFNVYFGQAFAWSRMQRPEHAARLVEEGLRLCPTAKWGYWMLANYRALAGDRDAVTTAMAAFRDAYPNATLATIFSSMPPLMRSSHSRHFDALRHCGLALEIPALPLQH
jgi:TolB-like protein